LPLFPSTPTLSDLRKRCAWARGSLKLRITLAGIAALVLGIVLITLLLVNRAERDTLAAQRQRELGESVRMASVLSRRVVELQRALQVVAAQLDEATLADDAALERFIKSKPVLRGLFANLYVATPNGQVRLYADEAGLRHPNLNIADRDYFRRTLAEGRPIVSEPIPGRVSGGPIVVFTHPVAGAGGILAVLGGALRLSNRDLMADLVDAQESDVDALLVVTDGQGRVLAHPDQTRILQPLSGDAGFATAFAAWVADGSPVEPSGIQLPQSGKVVSAAGVAGPNWMVWRQRTESELLAPLRSARREALVWAAGLIAVLSLAMLAGLWWLLRPLTLLERRAQHLFDGHLDAHEGWPAEHGEIGRLGRVLRHVTAERAQLEHFNNQVLGRLNSVMGAAPVGIAFTRNARFELVSAELCRLFGRTDGEMLGQRSEIIFAAPGDEPLLAPQAHAAFARGEPYVGEWQMRHADGGTFWARLRGKPVHASEPGAGAIWTINDISEQRRARVELEWSAAHDPLTGLANRKAFEQRAARAFEALPRSLPAAIVFIDLDHFKPINDTAGHAAGDAMLRAVAAEMMARVRASDLVVRLGGDEFALLLERCPLDVAMRVAENVRAAIAAIVLPWEHGQLRISASLGVACLAPDMPDVAAWVTAADAACYAAKAAGRGAVRHAAGQLAEGARPGGRSAPLASAAPEQLALGQ
jgi:diguanylate cyclase